MQDMDANNTTAGKHAVLATGCLIGGNLVGAGILGLPINTGLAGLLPSLLAMLAGGGMMYLTALILGEQAARSRSETFDYPSLYGRYLGRAGKWAAILANMIILYGLLTAYFTGGAKIVASVLGMEGQQLAVTVGFAAFLVFITCINLSIIQKLNALLMLALVGSFLVLTGFGAGHIQPERMSYTDWAFLPATLPIIVTAFHFHNIIPTATASLGWDMPAFRKSVLFGMTLAFIMNGLWVLVGIGVIPLEGENSILAAWETNLPATVPMSAQIKSTVFMGCASIFALIAISTSFLANGLGLQSFIRDLLCNSLRISSRPLVILLTFAPPFVIALIYPDIFLRALDVVGGVGIVVLFGVLPNLITLADRARGKTLRAVCLLGLLFSLAILGLEIMHECGLLSLKPWIEYHSID